VRFLAGHPAVLQRYGADLLALLVQVYGGTVVPQARAPPAACPPLTLP